VDAFARAGQGEAPTWPSDRPERRIDYIFVPEVLASVLVSCRRWEHPLAVQASDHLPVLAELEV
jgi:endonuclease/exonuclease/phosphatase family metal-dependent hydrolase